MAWPPELGDLKGDLKIPQDDTRDDEELGRQLAAAVAFVARVRAASFTFTGNPVPGRPEPTGDVMLGTVRLAGRWYTRRRSPDGLVPAGELGTSRVPAYDADIERLLGIGRYRSPVIA